MKKLLTIMLTVVFCLCCGVGFAADKALQFEWTQNPPEADLAGFTLEARASAGGASIATYDIPYTGQNTDPVTHQETIAVPDGQTTVRCFVVRAYDTSANVSDNSNEVCTTIDLEAPGEPQAFSVTIVISPQ